MLYCCWQYLGSSRLISAVPIERVNSRFDSVMTTYGVLCWKYCCRKVLASKRTAALTRAFQKLHSSSTFTLQIYFLYFFFKEAPRCDVGILIAFPLLRLNRLAPDTASLFSLHTILLHSPSLSIPSSSTSASIPLLRPLTPSWHPSR